MKTMKRFLALLLFFVAAMNVQTLSAQTNGDVNNDGNVNEADISAIIEIMKEANGVGPKKYYWYAGWTIPTAANISTIINNEYPVSSTNSTTHKAGGSTTVITGYTKDNPLYLYEDNLYNSTAKTNYYLVLPNGIGVWDSEGIASLLDQYTEQTSIVIPNHKVYKSNGTTRNISGLMLF